MVLVSGGTIAVVVLLVVAFIAICIVGWWISTSNTLKRLEIKVDEALSGIDIALTKRFDALTKMLDTTKGYAKHESETLENVIKWRSGIPANATVAERGEFASSLAEVATKLNIIVEKYPELKADAMFAKLQHAIMDTEEQLQAARRLYNSNVRILNTKIVVFPSSIVANKIQMTKRDFFEAEEAKRQDVKMEF